MTLDEFVTQDAIWFSTPHVRFLHVYTGPDRIEVAQIVQDREKAFQLKLVSRAIDARKSSPKLFWVPKAAFGIDKMSVELGLIKKENTFGGILPFKPWYIFKMEEEDKSNWGIINI